MAKGLSIVWGRCSLGSSSLFSSKVTSCPICSAVRLGKPELGKGMEAAEAEALLVSQELWEPSEGQV